MESFNELLNQFVQRAGISDSELARAIGVSRQTIFRWREGATARPRQREDVLAIARKIRLTPDERDTLLLAAGFRPESVPALEEVTEPESEAIHPISILENRKLPAGIAAAVLALLLIGGVIWWMNRGQIDDGNLRTPTTMVRQGLLPDGPPPAPAAEGETLVLVTHFANYASSQIGYNVAGRLVETLQREVDNIDSENLRIAVWPNEVSDRSQALQSGQSVSATLVIFGEYDVGRVVVQMVHPGDQNIFVDPALQRHAADLQDLSATINSDLPQQVRSLALLALGQISLTRREYEQAYLLLSQARNNLKNDPSVEAKTWGLVNFYLGIAQHHRNPPNLDGAIEAYTEALAAWPAMISSRLNRAAAYETRQQPGDLDNALADTEAVLAAAPDWAAGYNNRASIRLNLGGAENLALALADLEKALELNPDLPEVYINQAYIYMRKNRLMVDIEPILKKALALRPGYATAFNALCWGYALEQQPEAALPYCRQAIEADPRPIFYDSRGLTLALLGDYDAARADFETHLSWLETQPPSDIQQRELSRRRIWLEALTAGENPFTDEVLLELRSEFGE